MQIEEYLAGLPEERLQPMTALASTIQAHLPAGFERVVTPNMISWVVPHRLYAAGYHVDPSKPLPFLSIASQRRHIAVYHFGIYAVPTLLEWFTERYRRTVKTKLNMGKSCIRFTNVNKIPLDLLGELCTKMTTSEWITAYESQLR